MQRVQSGLQSSVFRVGWDGYQNTTLLDSICFDSVRGNLSYSSHSIMRHFMRIDLSGVLAGYTHCIRLGNQDTLLTAPSSSSVIL